MPRNDPGITQFFDNFLPFVNKATDIKLADKKRQQKLFSQERFKIQDKIDKAKPEELAGLRDRAAKFDLSDVFNAKLKTTSDSKRRFIAASRSAPPDQEPDPNQLLQSLVVLPKPLGASTVDSINPPIQKGDGDTMLGNLMSVFQKAVSGGQGNGQQGQQAQTVPTQQPQLQTSPQGQQGSQPQANQQASQVVQNVSQGVQESIQTPQQDEFFRQSLTDLGGSTNEVDDFSASRQTTQPAQTGQPQVQGQQRPRPIEEVVQRLAQGLMSPPTGDPITQNPQEARQLATEIINRNQEELRKQGHTQQEIDAFLSTDPRTQTKEDLIESIGGEENLKILDKVQPQVANSIRAKSVQETALDTAKALAGIEPEIAVEEPPQVQEATVDNIFTPANKILDQLPRQQITTTTSIKFGDSTIKKVTAPVTNSQFKRALSSIRQNLRKEGKPFNAAEVFKEVFKNRSLSEEGQKFFDQAFKRQQQKVAFNLIKESGGKLSRIEASKRAAETLGQDDQFGFIPDDIQEKLFGGINLDKPFALDEDFQKFLVNNPNLGIRSQGDFFRLPVKKQIEVTDSFTDQIPDEIISKSSPIDFLDTNGVNTPIIAVTTRKDNGELQVQRIPVGPKGSFVGNINASSSAGFISNTAFENKTLTERARIANGLRQLKFVSTLLPKNQDGSINTVALNTLLGPAGFINKTLINLKDALIGTSGLTANTLGSFVDKAMKDFQSVTGQGQGTGVFELSSVLISNAYALALANNGGDRITEADFDHGRRQLGIGGVNGAEALLGGLKGQFNALNVSKVTNDEQLRIALTPEKLQRLQSSLTKDIPESLNLKTGTNTTEEKGRSLFLPGVK